MIIFYRISNYFYDFKQLYLCFFIFMYYITYKKNPIYKKNKKFFFYSECEYL